MNVGGAAGSALFASLLPELGSFGKFGEQQLLLDYVLRHFWE